MDVITETKLISSLLDIFFINLIQILKKTSDKANHFCPIEQSHQDKEDRVLKVCSDLPQKRALPTRDSVQLCETPPPSRIDLFITKEDRDS